jgi:tRNA threonylcarbamoyladenosine biosynthesis protein TsaE
METRIHILESLDACSIDQVRELGLRLGSAAQKGDLIGLIGDLGAGKTTLAQAIGEGIGLPAGSVTSPTFTLVAEHYGGRIPLYHLDVYRLAEAGGLYELGFEDYLSRADGLLVIEWADRVAESLPEDRLTISLKEAPADPETRTVSLGAGGNRSAMLLRKALGDPG